MLYLYSKVRFGRGGGSVDADELFERVNAVDPALASRYAYLSSPIASASVARAEVSGGLFSARWTDREATGVVASARAEAGVRLSPSLRLSAVGGVSRFFQRAGALYTGVSAGLALSLYPEGVDSSASGLRVEAAELAPVFPVF